MGFLIMKISLNKDIDIGKVLFIVEGQSTEFTILDRVLVKLFDYQLDTYKRPNNLQKGEIPALPQFKYRWYKPKPDKEIKGRICVTNTQSSNIGSISSEEYLDNLFAALISDDRNAITNLKQLQIYYLFDRDPESNTNVDLIKDLMNKLVNSRKNNEIMQGMLLLSYPAVESFTLSHFESNTLQLQFPTAKSQGEKIKNYLERKGINQDKINDDTLIHAMQELFLSLDIINGCQYDLDNFGQCNHDVFAFEEAQKQQTNLYNALSLIGIALLDLGLIEITEDT